MPENFMSSWIVWAMLSAAFAALTAIFAKVGAGITARLTRTRAGIGTLGPTTQP